MNKAVSVLKFMWFSKGLGVVIFGLLIFSSCQKKQSEDISPKKMESTEKFLRHALITHSGIYTLVGAKPISEFDCLVSMPSEEELKQIYNRLSQRTRNTYTFEQVAPHFIEEYESWKHWEQIKDQYLGNNFRFFKSPWHQEVLFFANLSAVALILDKHYKEFKRAFGSDFEPVQMALEIDSPDSDFWKMCFKDHFLSGLLFGFGEENAKLFSWKLAGKQIGSHRFLSCKEVPESDGPPLSSLTLPSFVVYSPIDERVLFFKKMREEIFKLYEGKDFKELTLQLLGDDPK